MSSRRCSSASASCLLTSLSSGFSSSRWCATSPSTQSTCCSAPVGRVMISVSSGVSRFASRSRRMNASDCASAQCRSSSTTSTGRVSPRRRRQSRQASNARSFRRSSSPSTSLTCGLDEKSRPIRWPSRWIGASPSSRKSGARRSISFWRAASPESLSAICTCPSSMSRSTPYGCSALRGCARPSSSQQASRSSVCWNSASSLLLPSPASPTIVKACAWRSLAVAANVERTTLSSASRPTILVCTPSMPRVATRKARGLARSTR